nr:immunoglobulin heavy chain junction region [Macaca mulatta]MOW93818.1 immunoglobulin heavy chain junction region [Macaca mulatta]MOW94659.1 immunoglobulin heavy chain junction region [Macaca mulatta]MOW95651.1 immunoglobulin heavy chain junction region [Macaca mulatta]MOW95984.1 immunoglobulin heavy chain junction region [Macaca mulatta]
CARNFGTFAYGYWYFDLW